MDTLSESRISTYPKKVSLSCQGDVFDDYEILSRSLCSRKSLKVTKKYLAKPDLELKLFLSELI